MIIIVINLKCQIKQQSCVDNWRPVNVFCIFIQNQNQHDKNNCKIVSLSRDITKTKKDLNSQDSAMIDVIHINNSFPVN